MPLTLQYKGFDYVSYYNGGYVNADSLSALAATGANAAGLNLEYGIDVANSTVYSDANYTDSLTTLGNTISEAVGDGLSVMVKPLIDFLDPSKIGSYSVGDWRTYYNPTDPAAFFASYKAMLMSEASVAQAHGAAVFSIGTELDQLTGPQYLSYWTDIISSVRSVFSGKLTYAADWDDTLSPWQWSGHDLAAGTGNLATQVSFWSQLDYVGIDDYAALSDKSNPTLADLVAGWTQVPTDTTTKAVTGNQSLISYFESVAAATDKPLLFTEIGYESASDAASSPAGSATNVFDPALQANLYQAFFNAWSLDGNSSLAGAYFWNWDPNTGEVGPGHGANFSPQGLAAQDVLESLWLDKTPPMAASMTASGTASADLSAPHAVTLSVAANEAVYVGGLPQLTFSNGLTTTYVSGNGSNTLVFSASVTGTAAPGTVTGLAGGVITDEAGNAFNFSGASLGSYRLAISDSAADVAAHIDGLQAALANIASLTLTDAGTPTLAITDSQWLADAGVLALLRGPYDVYVTGVNGQPYDSFTFSYDATGQLTRTVDFNKDGSVTAALYVDGGVLTGTNANDVLTGGPGNDTVSAGAGNDVINMGPNLMAADKMDGGIGNDTVAISGDYSVGVTFSATTMVNVETLRLGTGFSYNLTTNDATDGAGQTLRVDASALGVADALTFNGAAETDGAFNILAGAGANTLTGGLGADTFSLSAASFGANDIVDGGTGAALDEIVLATAGTIAASAFTNVSHVEKLVLANGTNNVTLTNALVNSADDNFRLTVMGGTGNDTVNAGADAAGQSVVFYAGTGNDSFTGGVGADYLEIAPANLTSADTFNGGTGTPIDEIVFSSGATLAASAFTHVSHVEELVLGNGTNSAVLTDALVTSSDNGHKLAVIGGTGNDTINASAVTTVSDGVVFTAGTGNDSFTGGLDADTLKIAAADLTSADIFNGGTGTALDQIDFTTAGTITASAFATVGHVEELVLANGTNSVTLSNALVNLADDNHRVTVMGGTGNDTVNASADTTGQSVVFYANSGNDSFTGGTGADYLEISGANLTSADTFNGGTGTAIDEIVFASNATLAASAFTNVSHVEELVLGNGSNSVTLSNALVSSSDYNHKLTILGGTGADTINASAVTTTTDAVSFHGGAGADVMTASAGTDTFVYGTASESSSTGYDTIAGINFGVDRFDIPGAAGTITGIDTALTTGALSTATFDANLASDLAGHLAAHHAELFTASSGTLVGQEFLVIDLNGTAGYQAGQDIVIHLTGATGTLAAGDFV